MVVIVSKQAYLICEAVNYIVINESPEENDDDWSASRIRNKKKTPATTNKRQQEYIKKQKPYQIIIDFVSATKNNGGHQKHSLGNGGDNENVRITVQGLDATIALYTEIVEQIREQLPDVLWLDKLVERFLTTTEPAK